MGKGSKVKGSAYELKISKELAKWSGEQVHRVPQSGAGGHTWGADSRMNGDIVFPVESKNPFVIECKKREGWAFRHLLLNTGDIKNWWEQVIIDSRRMKQEGKTPCTPLLIFSKNRDRDYVLLPYTEDYKQVYEVLSYNGYPVSLQQVRYKDLRDEEQKFNTILTTLEGFTHFSLEEWATIYEDITWDVLNG